MKKIAIETNQAPAAIGPYTQALAVGPFFFVPVRFPWIPKATWCREISWSRPAR